ncbi:MAG: hypothetical protein ACUVXB_06735 [Bryobacteraceae bacterium]
MGIGKQLLDELPALSSRSGIHDGDRREVLHHQLPGLVDVPGAQDLPLFVPSQIRAQHRCASHQE